MMISAAFGGLAVSLLTGAYYVYMVYGDHSDLYQTTDMTPVTHKVGGRTFVIPKAYITYWRDWEPNDNNEFITVEALLPDMAAFNGDNADKFDPRHPDKLEVDMDLSQVPDGWMPNYSRFDIKDISLCAEIEGDFLVCPKDWTGDNIVTRKDLTQTRKFVCAAWDEVPNPHCEAYFPLVANVEMEVRFHRSLLKDSDQIVEKAYRLMCGFFRPELGVELEFDYCSNGIYFEPRSNMPGSTQ